MKKKKRLIIVIGVIVFLIAAALIFLRIRQNILAAQKQTQQVPSVQVSLPLKGDIVSKLSFSGDIIAIQQTNIYSRVTGNIQSIYVDIGDYVTRGKLLAVIDKSTYYQAVRQNEGLLNQTKATLENNIINYERTKLLFDKGLSPQGDLDNANMAVKVTEAQVKTAEANLQNANLQLSYCNITAPFSGYITKRLLDLGSLVSSSPQGQNSIFILSDISKLKILVSVLEKDIPFLENVREVTLTTDAYPGEIFTAQFKKMSQSIDLSTRTMPTQVDIDNRDNLLKPGMFAKIDLILDKHFDVLLIPSQAIKADDKGKFIFTISDDSVSYKTYIKPGLESDNKTEIVSGLNGNEKIVTAGQDIIKENIKVKISQ